MKTKLLLIIFVLAIAVQAYPQCTYNTEAVSDLMDSLATNFTSFCKKVVIGQTVLGRQIVALKISDNVTLDENEPEILLEGCIHGSEQPGTFMLCNLAREFCLQYNSNTQIQNLVNNREIWIVPIVNPDGFVGEPGWGPTKSNANYVDLNRDAGYMWTGSYGSSPGPFSQPESKVMRDFILKRNFNVMIDYHSGIQGIIYPWFHRDNACPDHNEVFWLANQYHSVSSYPAGEFDVTSGYEFYQTNGSLIEFAYGCLGIDAFGVELFNTFSGDGCIGIQYNRASMLMMIEKAGFGIQGIITDANTGQQIAAKIDVQGKMPVYNSPSIGDYHKFLKAGTYTVTFSANGYNSQSFNNISVFDGTSTTLDAQLIPNSANQSAFKVIITKNYADNQTPADPGISWNVPGMPDGLYYPLGDTGYVVLDIGSNIVNVSGYDIKVTGSSSGAGNGYELYCSSTPDGPWTLLGSGTSTQSFEMGNLLNVRYVKVIDNGSGPGNVIGAGFHLDAVSVVQTMVGIDEPGTKNASFQVYPNPAKDLINVKNSGINNELAMVSLFNITGRQIMVFPQTNFNNEPVAIDLSTLPKGIYFIKIQCGSFSETHKVIRE
jgi:hypothetical protein